MKSFERLSAALKRLPGIGPKQAQRMALHLIRAPESESTALIEAMRRAKSLIKPCSQCFDFAEREMCDICSDPARDKSVLCVVEHPQDVAAVEKSRGYRGLYHVLHGSLSPLDGVGPESLRVAELLDRARRMSGTLSEAILATDADTEGEATSLYLAGILKPLGIKITRIARGVPLGGDLEYVDEGTLTCALSGRTEVS